MLQVRVDRHRCIGVGNCIAIAPTAFDWFPGELLKAAIVDTSSVDEELLRQAALSCPTQAIVIEELADLLPWQLRAARPAEPQRVVKTFMFTDIVKSTNLVEAMGDEAWGALLRWHDQTLRSLFAAHRGQEVVSTGDGFFISFDSPDAAIDCAIAIQHDLAAHRRDHGFAPQVRIGIHATPATQVERNFQGKGVHEAARIAALAEGGEILASKETAAGRSDVSTARQVTLKGIAEPIELVAVDWR
jgi:class 3 adenylate cyclase